MGTFNNYQFATPAPYQVRSKLQRESSDVKSFWIPAFAGMTFLEVAFINDRVLRTKERDSVSRPNFSFPHHEDTVAAGTGEGEGRIARS